MSLFDLTTKAYAKPWPVGKEKSAYGFEVVEFTYEIEDALLQHTTAAVQAERIARDDKEFRDLLRRTPAGRMWLMVTPRGGIHLATDRKPTRNVFVLKRSSPFISRLYGVKGRISGFVL